MAPASRLSIGRTVPPVAVGRPPTIAGGGRRSRRRSAAECSGGAGAEGQAEWSEHPAVEAAERRRRAARHQHVGASGDARTTSDGQGDRDPCRREAGDESTGRGRTSDTRSSGEERAGDGVAGGWRRRGRPADDRVVQLLARPVRERRSAAPCDMHDPDRRQCRGRREAGRRPDGPRAHEASVRRARIRPPDGPTRPTLGRHATGCGGGGERGRHAREHWDLDRTGRAGSGR